jgi:hypothetical protein
LQIRHITQCVRLEELLIARQVLVQGLAQQAGPAWGFVRDWGEGNTMSRCRRDDEPGASPRRVCPLDGWVSP